MNEYKAPRAEMKELAPGVYAYLQPAAYFTSNAGLIVGKKEAIAVDSLTNKAMVESFIGEIRKVTDNPVRFLINTHVHGDHIYTNHFFTEATVICSSQCREDTKKIPPDSIEAIKQRVTEMSFEGAKITPQDLVFEKTLTFYQDEREVRLVCLGPGHSRSDTFVYLPKEKVVFCGDLMFGGPPLSLMGSVSCHIQNLGILASLDAKTYVPGHGPVLGKEALYASHEYLVLLRDEARKCFDKGIGYEEAAKTIDMSRFKEWSRSGLILANCARAYSEFRGEEPGSQININLTELVRRQE